MSPDEFSGINGVEVWAAKTAIAGLRDSGAGSVAAVSVADRAAVLGYAPSETVVPNLVAELRAKLQTALQTQENLESRLLETERDRLLAVERAERAEAELAGTKGCST